MEKYNAINFRSGQKAEGVYEIYLYDDVTKQGPFNWETWKYEESETSAKHFKEMLDAIPENAKINMYFNCNGGDVDQGTAIFNLLKRHPAEKTGYVDGVCHSIAFTIFQAMDHRIMGEGTSAIIHEMWGYCVGNADEMRKYADDLDVMMDSCVALFMNRAKGITEDELREMLKQETVLTPQKALEYGFCDEISDKQESDDPIVLQKKVEAMYQSTLLENKQLKEKLAERSEHQKQLVEFYQSTHKSEEPLTPPEPKSSWEGFF